MNGYNKEIKPVNPKGNQFWMFIRRTDADAETPVLWPPDAKNWLAGRDPDAGRDWGQEEKGVTEDEVVGMASLTQWTWVWVSSRSWCWTGKPGMLRSNSTKSWTWLSDWTKLKDPLCFAYLSLPSPLQPLATTDLLAVSKFCLFRSLCNWNHSTCRFFRPASFT